MIKLEHLNKTFSANGKTFHAVNDVNLEINKGEIFGIIGFSGAGKSTLAKKLGEIYNAEVLHFDTINFLPGWKEREKEEKERAKALKKSKQNKL